jgi:hypothetical protein
VLELWRYLPTGDLHSAVRFFDHRVRQAVRARDFSSALADERRDVEDAEPVIVGEEATPVARSLHSKLTSAIPLLRGTATY